jgi:hypothetical protein
MTALLSSDSYSYTNSLPSLPNMDTVITEGSVVRVLFGAVYGNSITTFLLEFITGMISIR